MKRNRRNSFSCSGQGGFSLISTLFMVVVLAALGGYMVRLNVSQQTTTTLSLQSVRAWYAASSGLEWAVYQIGSNNSCPPVPSSFSADGFTIAMTGCTSFPVTEGPTSYTLYDIQVTASRGTFGSSDFVSRRLRATVTGS
ncbi:MAG: pilus assembly protein MshP [Sedimenticola sp.]|uniref:Pilus assembly protein MshP n=1 Tax=Sedimenticola thiotaurini TaxID=1543721 RepID=A0A558CXH4_9GAMM|nr:pilus assembly protein MshP [Sedimenticola sp.]MCW8921975.1 pilus assembly protein MshP [Sedimenticola sp.]MCW8950927.1 pilus assembly protein MshP [Sedimenticola sp.]TVT53464.1 MAG: pilus assembly protein MshP [Sedimenticola thiotaurini]